MIRSACSTVTFFAFAAHLTGAAGAADLPTRQPTPPQPGAAGEGLAASCFASLYDFLIADPDDCPLAWNGIRFYGRIDVGGGYESHGVPFNGNYPNGVNTLIKKNGNRPHYTIAPNGLGQSFIGLKGKEPIASDWSLIFNLAEWL